MTRKEKIGKYLDEIGNNLLKVMESHAEKWENDPEMDRQDIGSMMMTAATTMAGEAMAMTLHGIGTNPKRLEEAMEMGGELIKKGAMVIAQATAAQLKDILDDWNPDEEPASKTAH